MRIFRPYKYIKIPKHQKLRNNRGTGPILYSKCQGIKGIIQW